MAVSPLWTETTKSTKLTGVPPGEGAAFLAPALGGVLGGCSCMGVGPSGEATAPPGSSTSPTGGWPAWWMGRSCHLLTMPGLARKTQLGQLGRPTPLHLDGPRQ